MTLCTSRQLSQFKHFRNSVLIAPATCRTVRTVPILFRRSSWYATAKRKRFVILISIRLPFHLHANAWHMRSVIWREVSNFIRAFICSWDGMRKIWTILCRSLVQDGVDVIVSFSIFFFLIMDNYVIQDVRISGRRE